MTPDLPTRLREHADTLNEWDHPITAREDVRQAARIVATLPTDKHGNTIFRGATVLYGGERAVVEACRATTVDLSFGNGMGYCQYARDVELVETQQTKETL
jgi:hypothetical protein